MRLELEAGENIEAAFIGMQAGLLRLMLSCTMAVTVSPSADRRMERADATAALYQRDDPRACRRAGPTALREGRPLALLRRSAFLDLTEIGLIGFHDFALAAQRVEAGDDRRRMASRMRWHMNQADL